MDDRTKEAVTRELVEVLGETKVFSRVSDLIPYTKDTYQIRFDEEYKYLPDFVVLPGSTEEVQEVVRIAARHKAPIIPKGGGSNRTGMLVPLTGGIVIDTIKMNKVIEVNVSDLCATVQPGITLAELDQHLARFGVSLHQVQGSFKVATVGGSISTSGFSRKHQKYGSISDRVMSLEVVLANGRVLRTGPKVLYTSTGYRLHEMFIGAEGTLGVITEATLRIEPLPEARDAVLAFYDDFRAAKEAGIRLMRSCLTYAGAEAYETDDATEWGAPKGKVGVFYVTLEGLRGEVESEKAFIEKLVAETGGIQASQEIAEKLLDRYAKQFCGARALIGAEDTITCYLPIDQIDEFYEIFWGTIMPKYGLKPVPGEALSLDVGKYRILGARYFIPKSEEGWNDYQKALREIAELATRLGGSISACHGVGIEHRDNLDLEYSEVALDTMREIKRMFDPDNLMNPGKKLPERKRGRINESI
jgi:glycolate oxidase